ncbi:hypothetical protein T492DRAFT_847799 [Pavlovales sp. CCMP2436]|nr:hypothetical protein T492DRAFT_847799 [Pavlovales sp. CCMP2436]
MPSRHEMKIRPRLGEVIGGDSSAILHVCKECLEHKSANEINHRRQSSGEIAMRGMCALCFRLQCRMSAIYEIPKSLGLTNFTRSQKEDASRDPCAPSASKRPPAPPNARSKSIAAPSSPCSPGTRLDSPPTLPQDASSDGDASPTQHARRNLSRGVQHVCPHHQHRNMFTSPGPPDKDFRLPNTSAGMDRLYGCLMTQGRWIKRALQNTPTPEPLARTWTLHTSPNDFLERDIDVDHQGAVRYIAKAEASQWKNLDRTGPQRPPFDQGLTYDITIETTESTSTGLLLSQSGAVMTFTQVVNVTSSVRSRFSNRIYEIEEERLLLPAGINGCPKAGVVRDPVHVLRRKKLNEQQKHIELRMKLLDEINVCVVADGGLKHGDNDTLMEIVIASSVAFIQFICPLQTSREVYWRVDNLRLTNEKENGVARTGITAFLVSPVHVVNMQRGQWVFSSEKVIKLDAAQMHAKREELEACSEVSLVTPSASCKSGQSIRTMNGDVFVFHSAFSEWKELFWDQQVHSAHMSTHQYGLEIMSIVLSPPLLTCHARFPMYEEMKSKYAIKNKRNRIVHESIGNIDQKKAYTYAFDPINRRFMGSDDSVDLSGINAVEMEAHLSDFYPNLDLACLTDETVAHTIRRLYTINVADIQETRLPRVLTFMEARFLLACGVRFNGLVALVSYSLIPIELTEDSYEKYSNIAHYAKAVGL